MHGAMEILRFASPRCGSSKTMFKHNLWGEGDGLSSTMGSTEYSGYSEFGDLSSNSTLPPFEETAGQSSPRSNNKNGATKQHHWRWLRPRRPEAFPSSRGETVNQPSRPTLLRAVSQPRLSQRNIQVSPPRLQREQEKVEQEVDKREKTKKPRPERKAETNLEKLLKSPRSQQLDGPDQGTNGKPKNNWETKSVQSAPVTKQQRLANERDLQGLLPGAIAGRPTLQANKSMSSRSLAIPRRAPKRNFSQSTAMARAHAGISPAMEFLDDDPSPGKARRSQSLSAARTGSSGDKTDVAEQAKRKTRSDHTRDRTNRRKHLTRAKTTRSLSPKLDPNSRRGRDGDGRIIACSPRKANNRGENNRPAVSPHNGRRSRSPVRGVAASSGRKSPSKDRIMGFSSPDGKQGASDRKSEKATPATTSQPQSKTNLAQYAEEQQSPWSTKKELMSRPLPRTKDEFASFFSALAANPVR